MDGSDQIVQARYKIFQQNKSRQKKRRGVDNANGRQKRAADGCHMLPSNWLPDGSSRLQHVALHLLTPTTSFGASLITISNRLIYCAASINGVPIGKPTGVTIFFSVPWGLRDLLIYTKEHYKNPVIYIKENGMGDYNNQTVNEGIKDPQRIDFYYHHLMAIKEAISKGVRVKGYIAWSFLDTFEWGSGFTYRFGLNFVDYTNNLKRTAKASAHWFQKFLLK